VELRERDIKKRERLPMNSPPQKLGIIIISGAKIQRKKEKAIKPCSQGHTPIEYGTGEEKCAA